MENENIRAVVDNAFTDNAVEMRNALYTAINDKIFAAIDARKQVVAQNLINSYEENTDTEEVESENTETETEE
jgi:hypothetical protein